MSRALITGCSTGIGRATAVELTNRGIEVVATARRPETLDDLDVALRLPLDVSDDASVRAAAEAAGDVDILVNNAAFGVIGPVETVPLDRVREMFETNVFGLLRTVQAFARGMRARGSGRIVNVSSVAGVAAVIPLNGLYAATKYAVEALTETLRRELRPFGIHVASIIPGGVDTPWHRSEQWLGVDEPPYDELCRQIHGTNEESLADAPPPESVATVIAEAIDAERPQRRWPATPDAATALRMRREMSDEEFEDTVITNSPLRW